MAKSFGLTDFTGSEVRVAPVSDLGELVSVTVFLTIDSGSTSFTVFLPRVNLPAPPALPALVPVIAQFEREMMLERQREGIAKAKAENRYMGRRPSARLKADEAVKLFKAGRSVTDIATALNIGRGSVYRALEAAGMKSASGWT